VVKGKKLLKETRGVRERQNAKIRIERKNKELVQQAQSSSEHRVQARL
jgi:hypothetical protein